MEGGTAFSYGAALPAAVWYAFENNVNLKIALPVSADFVVLRGRNYEA